MDDSRWLAALFSPDYLLVCAGYTAFMTFLWWLRRPLKNAGLVDFGWPSGLVIIAVYFFLVGTGWTPHRAVLCSLYAFCGVRFLVGWLERTKREGEDRRCRYWRKHWQEGNGPFGIRSIDFNYLIFYHAQTTTTLFVGAVPLALAASATSEEFHPLQWVALVLWVLNYILENLADLQLRQFRVGPEGETGVCRTGLWAYSRHPNYFFELMLWVAYALYAWPLAGDWIDRAFLCTIPLGMYWFLSHYTGIPLTEKASLERRGKPFRRYQQEVNRFIPWFPKKSQG